MTRRYGLEPTPICLLCGEEAGDESADGYLRKKKGADRCTRVGGCGLELTREAWTCTVGHTTKEASSMETDRQRQTDRDRQREGKSESA